MCTPLVNRSSAHCFFSQKLELREYDSPDGDDAIEPSSVGDEETNVERGMHAKEGIPDDTICMVVPRKCLITLEMGKALPIGQKILQSGIDLHAPRHIYLMIYMLWDRKVNGSSSFYHPYYEILPEKFTNVPIFWSDEELKWLQGSFLIEEVKDRIQSIEEDYNDILLVAPELADFATLEEFKWARVCVTSRNFAFQMDDERMSAMVPHADMLNHKRPCETRWTFDDDLDGFTIITYVYYYIVIVGKQMCAYLEESVQLILFFAIYHTD